MMNSLTNGLIVPPKRFYPHRRLRGNITKVVKKFNLAARQVAEKSGALSLMDSKRLATIPYILPSQTLDGGIGNQILGG